MKTAACLFSFDRPEYLGKTINSLKNNTMFHNVDWFLFQDNPEIPETGKSVGSISDCVSCFHEYILPFPNPKTTITTFNRNRGIPRMKLAAHKLTQDSYDWIFFFEDDMIVSPYYIELLLNMTRKFGPGCIYSACDLNMRAITSNIPKKMDVFFNSHLNLVKKNIDSHHWGYLAHSSVVRCISPKLEEYCNFIGPDYKRRRHEDIMKKFDMGISSHDRLIEITARTCGIERMNTVIPRARYIGEKGMHAKPEFYKERGFDKEWKFVFDEDRNRKEFTLV